MGGPGSGKRRYEYENVKQRAIAKAWNKINYRLGMQDNKVYDYALPLAVKDMTEHIKSDNTNINIEKKEALDNYFDRLMRGRGFDVPLVAEKQHPTPSITSNVDKCKQITADVDKCEHEEVKVDKDTPTPPV